MDFKKGQKIIFHWYQRNYEGEIIKVGRKYLYVEFVHKGRWRTTKFKPDDTNRHINHLNKSDD